MVKSSVEIFILAIVFLFALFTLPRNNMLITLVIAIIGYIATKSFATIIGLFMISILFNMVFQPKMVLQPKLNNENPVKNSNTNESMYTNIQREGFQPKDPISIHQRIEKEKKGGPLKENVDTITGVLESPNILDALQIKEVRPVEQGGSMKTQPSSLMDPEIIPTPAELTPPSERDRNKAPMANPVLQNGHDVNGIVTSLIPKGTSLINGNPSSNVRATLTSGPSAP